MVKYRIFLILVLHFFLSGCSEGTNINRLPTQGTQSVASSSTHTQNSILTTTVTPTLRSTPINYHSTPSRTLPSTFTSNPTYTPAVPPETKMQFNCLEIARSLSPDVITEGNLVIKEYGEGQRPVYLFGILNGEKSVIPETDIHTPMDMTVSPNGHWLAYSYFTTEDQEENSRKMIVIVDQAGQKAASVRGNGWAEISRWLNSESLIVKHSLDLVSELTILNPFNGEQTDLIPYFTNLYTLGSLPDWRKLSETVYDPTLTRVVYPRLTAEGTDIVLEDINNHGILARITPVATPHAVPIWSTDGSRFVVTNATIYAGSEGPQNFELYSVGRDGKITQITNLNSYFTRTYITNYRWSPNGRYIVFSLEAWQGESTNSESSWALLDTQSLEISNYCLEPYKNLFTGPFWSPDSTQFIVEVSSANGLEYSRLVLVDIVRNIAIQIAEDVIPYGWMSSP